MKPPKSKGIKYIHIIKSTLFRPVLVCFEEFKDREEVLRKAGMLKVKTTFDGVF